MVSSRSCKYTLRPHIPFGDCTHYKTLRVILEVLVKRKKILVILPGIEPRIWGLQLLILLAHHSFIPRYRYCRLYLNSFYTPEVN
jgi:hypothetical protein